MHRFLEFPFFPIRHTGEAETVQFREVITDRSQVEERIRREQCAVLSPNTDPVRFLDTPEDKCPPVELTFTSDSVQIEISDRNLTNLSFFDLPGMLLDSAAVQRLTPIMRV